MIVKSCLSCNCVFDLRVTLGDGKSSCLADIRANVCGTLLDCKHNNAADHRHLDTAEHTKGHCTNKRVAVRQVFLESVDRQKRKIRLLLCISKEVDVDQLPYLEVVRGDILDDLCKIFGDISTFRDQLI